MNKGIIIVFIIGVVAALAYSSTKHKTSKDSMTSAPNGESLNANSLAFQKSQNSGVHLNAIDTTMSPTDDFYQYANGGWLDNTEIPPIYSGYTVYHEVYERTDDALRKIIEQSADRENPMGSEAQKVGDLYSSYMDTETINDLGIKAIHEELAIVANIKDKSTLSEAFAKLIRYGIRTPYNIEVYPDLKNSTVNAVYLSQSGLTLSNRDYYLDLENKNFDKARSALPRYIRDILVPTGLTVIEADAAATIIYRLCFPTGFVQILKNRLLSS
jgi:putative endopeptidase